MKHFTRILLVLVVASVLAPAGMYAQKKKRTAARRQQNTPQLVTYPQRDDAFRSSFKLTPLGSFKSDKVTSMDFFVVPAPDFEGHLLKRDTNRKQVKLQQVSCRQNQITDDDDWFIDNGLPSRETRIETPMDVFGPRFTYNTGGYLVTTYGENWGNTLKMIITDEHQQQYYAAYDFQNYIYSPKTTLMGNTQSIDDVVIEGNMLYVSHGSNSYSDGAGNQTGYITAFDMQKREIIWTTQPMTCNSKFAVCDNSIICGYGFTGESDNLYVIDKYSGQRVQRYPLKKMAFHVIVKNNKAYVRTYSYDYVFDVK